MPKIFVRVGGVSLSRRISAALQSAEWQTLAIAESEDFTGGDVLVACTETLRVLGFLQRGRVREGQVANVKIVAVLDGEDNAGLHELMGCGVHAVVERDDSDHHLRQAVRAALSGTGWISPVFAIRLLELPEGSRGLPEGSRGLRDDYRPGKRRLAVPAAVDLTPREEEILILVAAGLSNGEIAMQEHITVRGVKFHVTNLLRKFECRDRAQLTALVHGVVPASRSRKNPVPGSR